MGAFHRGEITLRKLRVMIENLPGDNPARWHHTDGHEWTNRYQLIWQMTWAMVVEANKGLKKGTDIFEKMPKYPWKSKEKNKLGGWKHRDGNEVLDYLDNL